MNRQSGNKTGELLYHYYQKRIESFLFNIYQAGITAKEDYIHKARVDLKKIFALFEFFKMIGLDKLTLKESVEFFHDIFVSAGQIREIQMNLLYLDKLEIDGPDLRLFYLFLKHNSKRRTKRFIQSIIKFDEKRLANIRRTIKKSCRKIAIEEVIEKCDIFFQLHSARIKKYRLNSLEAKNIHQIRKEMKKISAVAGLLKQLRVDEFIEQLITSLSQTEVLIGDWHDKVVLNKSLDNYIKKIEKKPGRRSDTLERVKSIVEKDMNDLIQKLLPEVDAVVSLIDEIPLPEKPD